MPQKNPVNILYQAQSFYKRGEHAKVIRFLKENLTQIKGEDQKCLAYLTLGKAHYQVQQKIQALEACQKAVQLMPSFDYAWYELGNQFSELRCYEQALAKYLKALALNPKDERFYLNIALMLRECHRDDEAVHYYDELLKQNDLNPNHIRNKVSCVSYDSLDSIEYRALKKVIENPLSSGEDNMYALFALAKIYDDCGAYEKAQSCAVQANDLRSKIHPFYKQFLINRVDSIIDCFQSLGAHQVRADATSRPTFIVGLSRSGKSLVESFLDRHPQVFAKRECCFMGDMISHYTQKNDYKLFYPKAFQKLIRRDLKTFAGTFLSHLEYSVGDSCRIITDTTPQNIEHLGLLKMMFPNARFILCHRNIKDNYLKIFFKYYVSGNSYSHRIKDIHLYHTHMKRLCDFWENQFGIDFHHVTYESLIKDTQQTMRHVFEFCQLDMPKGIPKKLSSHEIGIGSHYPMLFRGMDLADYTSASVKATGS